MKKNILELIKERRVYFDGGTGTVLQKRGLVKGKAPEAWNIENPQEIVALHKAYLEAGADIVKSNTFGVNSLKYSNYEELIEKALMCAKEASLDYPESYIAFDMGPLGKLLKPWGDLDFLEAVEVFKKNAILAKKYGADLILIETMNDAYETKAALLAAKEVSDLPVFVTNVYDEGRRLMTGADSKVMVSILEGLGADAIGMNCSQGPDKMLPVVQEFNKISSLPIIVNPNAGLPFMKDGETMYSFDSEVFSTHGIDIAKSGGAVMGGCCGTNPEYIKLLKEKTDNIPASIINEKDITLASTYSKAVDFSETVILGEMLDIEKSESFKDALADGDYDYAVDAALDMSDEDASVITLNMDGYDDKLSDVVFEIQSVSNISMLLKSKDIKSLEKAARIYNGKPLIYVYKEMKEEILAVAKKYGAVIVTEDKESALNFGIKAKDIVSFDSFELI